MDECWWLVKRAVPLMRILSPLQVQVRARETCGQRRSSSAYPAPLYGALSVNAECEREIGVGYVRYGKARHRVLGGGRRVWLRLTP